MKKLVFICLLFLIFGCSVKTTKIGDTKNFLYLSEDSPEIYFVADNQFHIADGRNYPIQNYLADKFSGVAVRPPQTTIFGPYAYEAFLENLDQSSLLIHLGDASDVSCPQELNRFFTAMEKYKGPWLFVPGNHDGFYTGNSQYKKDNTEEWDYACLGDRLDKSDAIITYLNKRFNREIKRTEKGVQTVKGEWSEKGIDGRYLSIINNDPDSAQTSFITQQVRLKTEKGQNVRIIILDTSQYKNPPKYRNLFIPDGHKVAGITGEMLDDQMEIVKKWLAESKEQGDLLYIAGHHPLKSWAFTKEGLAWKGGSKWLKDVMTDYKGEWKGYLSAHTHKGGTRQLWDDKTEWNVASLVDWPLGFRAMWLNDGDPVMEEILFDSDIKSSCISGTCSDLIEWKSKSDDFHYYTKYRDQKSTGPTGRYMQHYLLIAELKVIVEALNKLEPEGPYSTLISAQKDFIKGAEARFDLRTEIKSADEIEVLRKEVSKMMNILDTFTRNASPSQRSRINKYYWCQLWWAAKEDAQRQWEKDDVTGERKKWD